MGFFSGLSDALFGGGGSNASTTQNTSDTQSTNTVTNTDNRVTSSNSNNTSNVDSRSWIDSRNLADYSTSTLDSNNTDSRSWTDSRNLGDYSTTTITSIDAGAVDLAKSIGNNAITSNSTNTNALFAAADKLFGMQQSALDANVSLAKSLAGTAQTAYSDAASTAQGNKPVLYGALAVMALIAASFFRKK
jgi:hypothetical protein